MAPSLAEYFERIAALARADRMSEAQAVADAAIQEEPELAAQWLILARVMRSREQERQEQLERRLAEMGQTEQSAFYRRLLRDETPSVLPSLPASSDSSTETDGPLAVDEVLAELNTFLGKIQRRCLSPAVARERLEAYLAQITAFRVRHAEPEADRIPPESAAATVPTKPEAAPLPPEPEAVIIPMEPEAATMALAHLELFLSRLHARRSAPKDQGQQAVAHLEAFLAHLRCVRPSLRAAQPDEEIDDVSAFQPNRNEATLMALIHLETLLGHLQRCRTKMG